MYKSAYIHFIIFLLVLFLIIVSAVVLVPIAAIPIFDHVHRGQVARGNEVLVLILDPLSTSFLWVIFTHTGRCEGTCPIADFTEVFQ